MASIGFLEAFICFLIVGFFLTKKAKRDILTNWPIFGMLPGLVVEIPRIYDFAVDVLEAADLTFPFKGPWFAGIDMLVTVDPLLDHVAEENMVVDLQDIFQRFTFDTTFILATGYDPGCLSLEMPEVELATALDDAEEAIFFRHIKPQFVWKLQNYMGLGVEKKMKRAHATFDRICAEYISLKREDLRRGIHSHGHGEATDLLTAYINVDTNTYSLLNPTDDKFLRDTILTFLIAGRDTTGSALTWFFWLLSNNPEAVTKIRQEINTKIPRNENSLGLTDLNKLMYLHGALCEALRLYPPVPFQHKSPKKPDVLPSGHRVDESTKILFSLYALGRMKAVWGEDASEFKPERWISERGGVRHEPSFKFLSFNAGPRTCLGKEVAFMQMKTVAVNIIQNYDIKVVEGHRVDPLPSIILHMKHGLKVTVTKRRNSLSPSNA